jgi:hypothetical protein
MLPAKARAVFISYAHTDNESEDLKKRWLDRFVEFLKRCGVSDGDLITTAVHVTAGRR